MDTRQELEEVHSAVQLLAIQSLLVKQVLEVEEAGQELVPIFPQGIPSMVGSISS